VNDTFKSLLCHKTEHINYVTNNVERIHIEYVLSYQENYQTRKISIRNIPLEDLKLIYEQIGCIIKTKSE